jgi:hypothetical protein
MAWVWTGVALIIVGVTLWLLWILDGPGAAGQNKALRDSKERDRTIGDRWV